ncbi:MAG: protein kinase, partial [Gemmatimonadales bacterium]
MTSLERLIAALADRYRIERELGQGGMATVYLAQDLKHDRKVALKVLKPELAAVIGAERFVVEIKTTAALQHPHILPLFDSGTADSFLYYVMPFIDGETLRTKLDRETQFGIDESVRITTAVADALDYAHRHGVVHRDIKPENILLHDGRPMVADFGIALALSAAAGGRMTETGMSLGTPHYMSPEQATAEKEITARSDVYSLGSVLYEMLTGNPPHTGASAQQIIMKIVTEEAAPVTKLRKAVPPNVAAAVAQSLEKLPADRFASAKAFGEALVNQGFRHGTMMMAGFSGTERSGVSVGRRVLPWAVAAGLAVVAGVLGMILLRSQPPQADVVRFELHVPSNQRIGVTRANDAPFALSPDGTRIVYSGWDSTGQTLRLYVRSLDQIEASPLQGTEDGVAPFFSPDGKWIAFATEADQILKKVPVAGGPAIKLADDVQASSASGSWGDDNTIVYVSDNLFLSRVSGGGGVSTRLNLRDSKGYLLWPSMLPGSKALLAQRCARNCSSKDLVVFDLATKESTVLVPGALRGWYLPTGQLVYATEDGAVFAVAFDLGKRVITGDPVPVLGDVRLGRNFAARLSVAADAGTMMYLEGFGATGVELVEVDRSGRSTPVRSVLGNFGTPRWSPTGDRIAMTVLAKDGIQVWIYDTRSQTLAPLTRVGNNIRPSWSPEGDRLAFWTESRDTSRSVLSWMPADGSAPATPVSDSANTRGFSTTFWTRDGAWILFDGIADDTASQEDIFAVSTGDDRRRMPVVVTNADEQAGAVSP